MPRARRCSGGVAAKAKDAKRQQEKTSAAKKVVLKKPSGSTASSIELVSGFVLIKPNTSVGSYMFVKLDRGKYAGNGTLSCQSAAIERILARLQRPQHGDFFPVFWLEVDSIGDDDGWVIGDIVDVRFSGFVPKASVKAACGGEVLWTDNEDSD